MASGRVLDFKQAIGGSDQVINLELLPEQTKTFTYNFGQDVSTYTFELDYMALVADTLTYSTANGAPNYASTNVIGYLGNIDGAGNSTVTPSCWLRCATLFVIFPRGLPAVISENGDKQPPPNGLFRCGQVGLWPSASVLRIVLIERSLGTPSTGGGVLRSAPPK